MGGSVCCVINCKNTSANSKFKFYRFPTAVHKLEQKKKWIAAINRKNIDGSPWIPRLSDTICSEHFIGHKKAEEIASPSYIPTIFPSNSNKKKIKAGKAALQRHERFMKRRTAEILAKMESTRVVQRHLVMINETNNEIIIKEENNYIFNAKSCIDKECQLNNFIENSEPVNTFICNRYIYNELQHNDAEIQTDIVGFGNVVTPKSEIFEVEEDIPFEESDEFKYPR